jgi:hypothetical protein
MNTDGYLKVALKKIIDDVSALAIEQFLIQKLPALFDPETVYDMKEEGIASLTAESKETAAERTWCTEKLAILEAGLLSLKHFDKHQLHSGESQEQFLINKVNNFISISDYDEHTEDMDDPIGSSAGTLSPKTPADSHHAETAILQSDNEEEATAVPAKQYEKEVVDIWSPSPKKSKKDKGSIVVPKEQRVEEEEDGMFYFSTKPKKKDKTKTLAQNFEDFD